MKANGRVILEVTQNDGEDPFVEHDSDVLFPIVTYEDVVARGAVDLVIPATGATDQAFAIPASCVVIIIADDVVLLRLDDGETQMRGRYWYFGSEDSGHSALSARDLLFSSNGTTPVNVKVSWIATVT